MKLIADWQQVDNGSPEADHKMKARKQQSASTDLSIHFLLRVWSSSVCVNLKHEAKKKRSHESELFLEFAIANLLQHPSTTALSSTVRAWRAFSNTFNVELLSQIFQQLLQPGVFIRLVPHVSSHSLRQRPLPGTPHRAPSTPVAGSPAARVCSQSRKEDTFASAVEDHRQTAQKSLLYIIDYTVATKLESSYETKNEVAHYICGVQIQFSLITSGTWN
jgi:hypothetical protein